MVNNLVFLNEREYYRKRANIIEEWKDCEIKLVYTDQTNFVGKDKPSNVELKRNLQLFGRKTNGYTINIQTPRDPHIPTKTAVYHELSHLLWDSFSSESFAILRKWAKDKTFEMFEQKQIPRQTGFANIPYHIQQEISKTQSTMEKYIGSLYINCFNCLEDQRIESLTKEVWLATESMFDEAKTNLGKTLSGKDMISPSNHLLAARFNRPEFTTQDYIDAMKNVEGTDENGAIAEMRLIKDLIDEGIGKNLENPLSNMKRILDDGIRAEGKQNDYNSISSKYEEERRKFDSKSENPNAKDLMETFRDKMGTKSLKEQMERQSQEAKQELHDAQALERKEKAKNLFRISESSCLDENAIKKKAHKIVTLSEAKESGKRQVNHILEKMNKHAVPKEPAHILTDYCRPLATPNPNKKIAAQLAKTFDKIKETRKFKISESGSEIDIEALLQAKSKGYGEFMVDEVRSRGLTILVSIDGSSSMQGDKIESARNLVATMFRSVERIPQVKILANVWSSDTKGYVGITPVRTEGECNRINISRSLGYTPTHEALKYSAKQLGKYSGKKLLIMITDGRPQYHRDGKAFSEQILVNLAVKEYRKGQKYCKNMMCINISPTENEVEEKEELRRELNRLGVPIVVNLDPDNTCKGNLKRIFKKNYVEFPGMERASEFVLKNFRKTVNATLRR